MKKISDFLRKNIYCSLVVLMLIIVSSVLIGAFVIQNSFRKEELQKFRHTYAAAINFYLQDAEYEMSGIKALAQTLKGEKFEFCVKKVLDINTILSRDDDFDKIGIADMQGHAFFANNVTMDLSKDPAYLYARNGNIVNHVRMAQKYPGDNDAQVQHLCPVYDDNGKVSAVVIAAYSTKNLIPALNVEFIDTTIPTYVIESNGDVFTSNGSMIATDNICKLIISRNEAEGKNIADRILSDIQAGNNNEVKCTLNEPGTLMYAPLKTIFDGSKYYFVSFMPDSVLDNGVTLFWSQFKNFLFFGTLAICLLIGGIVVLYQNLRNKIDFLSFTSSELNAPNLAKFESDLISDGWENFNTMAMRLEGFYESIQYKSTNEIKDLLNKTWAVLLPFVNDKVRIAHLQGDMFLFAFKHKRKETITFIDMVSTAVEKFIQINNLGSLHPCFSVAYVDSSRESLKGIIAVLVGRLHTFNFSEAATNYVLVDQDTNGFLLPGQNIHDVFENAVNTNQFEVMYRPKIGADGKLTGGKICVYWCMEYGKLQSEEFTETFGHNGLLARLDSYCLRVVCRQLRKWKEEGKHLVPVLVFVSSNSLYQLNLVDQYRNILDLTGVDPQYILLEFTEAEIIQIPGAKEVLKKFTEAGFRICLGGYTGRFSAFLGMEGSFLNMLSIGRSITKHFDLPIVRSFVRNTVAMAREFGIKTCLCGIDTQQAKKIIDSFTFDEMEGEIVSPPLPADEFGKLLDKGEIA